MATPTPSVRLLHPPWGPTNVNVLGGQIAIVGGGLAGLVLASFLHTHGIEVITGYSDQSRADPRLSQSVIYERDASASAREHLGGNLDLHEESGQLALASCGLTAEFEAASLPEGEEMFILDPAGSILWHDKGHAELGGPSRPEIDRTVLRKILIDSLPPSFIKWDHALLSATPLEGGLHQLTFANGTSTTSSLVVGADGIWSKVRPLVSPATAHFAGWCGAEISISPATAAARPDLSDQVGQGTLMCCGNGRTISTQRQGDGRVRIYTWLVRDEDDFALPSEPAAAKARILGEFEGWPAFLRELIELADPGAVYPRPLYALPVGHRWESTPGVTLIGDASHAMVPFAGEVRWFPSFSP